MSDASVAPHRPRSRSKVTATPPDSRDAAPFDLTGEVASFVSRARLDSVPSDVIDRANRGILDSVGVALAGSTSSTGRLARRYLQGLGLPPGNSTVIGESMRTAPRFAAFANGIAIHADDFDDTQLAVAPDRVYGLLTHPSAPALSAALAVAEAQDTSGQSLLLAYVIGIEVECKIAEAISPRHYEAGFHTTGTCGVFASAAAACSLYQLSEADTATALSIAASQAAGLRENFGSMTKPLHAGRAAEAGIVAADLARLGWSASRQILQAPRGFFQAAGGGYDKHAISGKLGTPWTVTDPGVSIKPYPSGSLTHPAMTEMLRLIELYDLDVGQVRRVRVGTNRHMPTALIHHRPLNALQAKFSMEFCLAILLLKRRAGLAEFTDGVVNDAAVQELLARVEFYVHPEADEAGSHKMTSIIDIELANGEVISGRADYGKGSPQHPMTYDEVAAKFRACAAYAGWNDADAGQIVELVAALPDLTRVRELTEAVNRSSPTLWSQN